LSNEMSSATKIIAFAIASCLLLNWNPAYADEKAEMAQLQKEIEALQKELRQVQGTRSGLQKELEKSERQIDTLQKKADDIKQQLKEQKKELNQLQSQRNQLEIAQQQQQIQIAHQVRAAYKLGERSEIKLLLNQESPDRISRLMKYHQYVMQHHTEKIQSYTQTIAQIDELTPKILSQTEKLKQTQQELDAQQDALSISHQERSAALAKVNAQYRNKNQELNALNQDRKRLQELLNRVTKRLAKNTGPRSPDYVPLPKGGEKFSQRRGRLPWPTQGVMVHKFGSARIAGQMNWNGAYISAALGNPVIAVHFGRVVFADYFGGHGLLMIVDHGEGYLSLYAHNQRLLKKAGDPVSAGEAIASVGNSGGQNKSGLYFEIRQEGKPIDPSRWLAHG
jgi:murein hydrolase activator